MLKDLNYIISQSYDVTPGVPEKIKNRLIDMIWTIDHQEKDIFIDQFFETMKFIEIKQEHHVNVFNDNFHIDGQLCVYSQNETNVEIQITLFNYYQIINESCDVIIYDIRLSSITETSTMINTCLTFRLIL